ncbi:hypothetical protein SAMN05216377_10858 [Pseudonocardia oroxyli]|uniref:Uncharacterized protein n=1 Tax=Pseudonocardia oroxyli TaxID=366584 RepID=A0A1G7QH80_PSEOR|nr:hypothetical protein SAMN05216377_10858 [Pseudonocardia oroxyli]
MPIPAGVTVIEGTSWAGTDSDGDAYVYTFNPGGRYAYQSPNGSFGGDDDTWAQTGDQLVMKTSGGYATYIGTVGDGVISGTASNIQGRTWTWTAKQQ